MEPIYDRQGRVIGWIHDGRILDGQNRYRGFLSGDSLHAMNGRYLGRYRRGFFRDRSGAAVAFTAGSTGGPLTPITQIPPIPPIGPINPIPPISPIAPIESLNWGDDWEVFLNR